jgi:putative flippase GtrA
MRRVGDRAARVLSMPLVGQFVKFGIVGVSNTLIFFLVYTLLLKVFGVWYVAASGIGFAVGATNGFLWNRRWTFREHVGDALTPVRWFVVQTSGLFLNLGLVYLLVDGAGLGELLGQAVTIVIVTLTTFFANRAWTFKTHPEPALVETPPTVGTTAER